MKTTTLGQTAEAQKKKTTKQADKRLQAKTSKQHNTQNNNLKKERPHAASKQHKQIKQRNITTSQHTNKSSKQHKKQSIQSKQDNQQ